MDTSLSPEKRAQLDSVVQKMHENGESDEYIQAAVNDFKQKNQNQGQLLATPPEHVLFARMLKRRGAEAAPTAGGIAGAAGAGFLTAGNPWAMIAGAGVGGSAGEGARQAILGEKVNPLKIYGGGVEQSAAEALGQGAMAGLARGGGSLMRGALGIGTDPAANFAPPERTVIKAVANVTKSGFDKLRGLHKEAVGKLMNILQRASLHGTRVSTDDVLRGVDEVLADPSVENDIKSGVSELAQKFRDQYGASIDPVVLRGIKRRAQNASRSIFTRELEGGMAMGANQEFKRGLASGSKTALEQIKGVAEAEGAVNDLRAAKKAVRGALKKPQEQLTLHHPQTWPVVGMLGKRSVRGKAALIMSDKTFQRVAGQSPRAAALLFHELMASEPDSTNGR